MPVYDRTCRFHKSDCFAHTKFGCAALVNTAFRNGICPFYKPAVQRQEELAELERRWKEHAEYIDGSE